jgi:hypothetical protein
MADPAAAAARIAAGLRRGGVLIVEEIDFTASFCHPANAAYDRYVELYTRAAWARGVDPNIGPRLPQLLVAAGCERVGVNVVQPAGMTPEGQEGDIKLVSPLTLENIADSAIAEGLATHEEIEAVVDELYRRASDTTTVLAIPRTVVAWGYRGELVRGRIAVTPEAVAAWVGGFGGRELHVALEACTGWFFVSEAQGCRRAAASRRSGRDPGAGGDRSSVLRPIARTPVSLGMLLQEGPLPERFGVGVPNQGGGTSTLHRGVCWADGWRWRR